MTTTNKEKVIESLREFYKNEIGEHISLPSDKEPQTFSVTLPTWNYVEWLEDRASEVRSADQEAVSKRVLFRDVLYWYQHDATVSLNASVDEVKEMYLRSLRAATKAAPIKEDKQ